MASAVASTAILSGVTAKGRAAAAGMMSRAPIKSTPTILTATATVRASARVGVIDPLGVALESGLDLYGTLLEGMAALFEDCLAPK